MLHRATDLRRCRIHARDGELGNVADVFFDDRTFELVYVVVETGDWLPGKRVLVPRRVLGATDATLSTLQVELTREEIENGPGVDSDPPLSLDAKLRYYDSYVWTSHPWDGFVGSAAGEPRARHKVVEPSRTHVRSAREVEGYRIEARDGRIGHVDDFLVSPDDWTIRYVVVDTRNWLPGRHVVVPPDAIERLEWADGTAHVALTKDEIEGAPELRLEEEEEASGPTRLLRF